MRGDIVRNMPLLTELEIPLWMRCYKDAAPTPLGRDSGRGFRRGGKGNRFGGKGSGRKRSISRPSGVVGEPRMEHEVAQLPPLKLVPRCDQWNGALPKGFFAVFDGMDSLIAGHPGGMPEGSRGLSASDTPGPR